jgi:hypothetical protein
MKRNFAVLLLSLVSLGYGADNAVAQHGHAEEVETPSDQNLFGKVLREGSFEFHLRSFFMSTVNQGDLMDYSTWGTGAGLGYFSPRWKGLGVGFSGFFVFRHYENNIKELDPITGLGNRYELLLYDVNHPDNNKDMDRLEEFYLSYQNHEVSVWAGRHHFESPLLNASDNRMRPNLFSGLSVDYTPGKWRFNGAWFSHVISRGTLEWVPVKESFGTYSTGRNPLDSPESYKHHIESKGIGVLAAEYNTDRIHLQSWNYLAEGVFGNSFLQLTGSVPLKSGPEFVWGVQSFAQTALGDGGNPDPEKAYTLPDERTYGVGMRGGLKWPHALLTFNYLGISDKGRFLFPREWGREQFFVSLQRERFEGLGGVNAFMVQYDHTFIHDKLKVSFGASHTKTPDFENVELNKYGIPNYFHFSSLIDYRFSGFFKGLDLQLLVVGKKQDANQKTPIEYVINRVNMVNTSLILDYRF